MHAIEKILAKNSGRKEVRAGEIVTAKVDFAEINDLYLQTVYSFYEMGGEKVWDNTRCAFVFDHYAPCPDIKSAANHKEMRQFAQKNNLKYRPRCRRLLARERNGLFRLLLRHWWQGCALLFCC